MRCDCGASLVKTTSCEQYKVQNMVLVVDNIPTFECPSCQASFYEDAVLDRLDEIVSSARENVIRKDLGPSHQKKKIVRYR